ncbi:MAG: hypothetical protein INH37_08760, partial [Myxococcaceae bacterium]|nr:hypothetical protein [Myxococcaceae bacterium]
MSLSARTKELLERARHEAEPSADDLRRVRARLASSLATEEPALTAVPLAFVKVAGAVALTALGLGVWQALRQRERPAPAPAPAGVSSALVCPPSPECPALPPPAPPPSCPPPAPAPACAPATGAKAAAGEASLRELSYALPAADADRWALEVGLLVDARVALDEGRSLDALGHAQRHQRLFPESAFREERLAVEVVATCQVKRPDLARAPLRALLALAPASTYLPRLRHACGWEDLD